VVVNNNDDDDDDDHDFEEVEYIVSSGGKGKGKKRGRGKRKKNKGHKKLKKYGKKAMYGLGAMKLIFDHFLLKKILFLAISSFILSKTSFLISALLALKHYLSMSHHSSEKSSENKLQVVHIPVRSSKHRYSDYITDESKMNNLYAAPLTTTAPETNEYSESELFSFYDQNANSFGSNNNFAGFQPDFPDNNINYYKFI
jgi:hypothetical protein